MKIQLLADLQLNKEFQEKDTNYTSKMYDEFGKPVIISDRHVIDHRIPYNWLCKIATEKLGPAPYKDAMPVIAWAKYAGGLKSAGTSGEARCLITLEIPEERVFLLDHYIWEYFIIFNWPYVEHDASIMLNAIDAQEKLMQGGLSEEEANELHDIIFAANLYDQEYYTKQGLIRKKGQEAVEETWNVAFNTEGKEDVLAILWEIREEDIISIERIVFGEEEEEEEEEEVEELPEKE